MRVFLTGATGLIGTALVPELIAAGHQVLGLTRTDSGVQTLLTAGSESLRGDLKDSNALRDAAAQCDGVIHCAFDHDPAQFEANGEIERQAIAALGAALQGSSRPLIVTTGLGLPALKRPITENVDPPTIASSPRSPEQATRTLQDRGINVIVVRVPQVHDALKQGLITTLIDVARQKGVSAYVAEGLNLWPAAHVLDVARLYRLALEKREPARYHAVAEEGIPLRDIAAAIGKGLGVPVVSIPQGEAAAHFGRIGAYVGADLSASSEWTQQQLGWSPTGPGLIEDIGNVSFFKKSR